MVDPIVAVAVPSLVPFGLFAGLVVAVKAKREIWWCVLFAVVLIVFNFYASFGVGPAAGVPMYLASFAFIAFLARQLGEVARWQAVVAAFLLNLPSQFACAYVVIDRVRHL